MNDRKRRRLALIAVILGVMGFVYASIPQDIAFEYIGNNTDLCQFNHTSMVCDGERQMDTVYWANESPIVLNVFAHADTAGQTAGVFIYRNGVLYAPQSGRPLASPEQTWRDPGSVIIPKGWNYSVNVTNYHHFEWREDKIISGRNGTLYINQTLNGCTGDCSFNNLVLNSLGKNNTLDAYLNYIHIISPFKNIFGGVESFADYRNGQVYTGVTNNTNGNTSDILILPDFISITVSNGFLNTIDISQTAISLISNGTSMIFDGTYLDLGGASIINCANCTLEGKKKIYFNKTDGNYTWINITGLDIRTDLSYSLELNIFTYTAPGTNIQLFINNDINISNYTRQYVYADGTTIISARDNDPGIIGTQQNWGASAVENIYLDAQGRGHYVSQASLNVVAGVVFFNGQYTHNNFQNNITTLNIKATAANGIGKGSEIILTRP